jgi:hypothetical protein
MTLIEFTAKYLPEYSFYDHQRLFQINMDLLGNELVRAILRIGYERNLLDPRDIEVIAMLRTY